MYSTGHTEHQYRVRRQELYCTVPQCTPESGQYTALLWMSTPPLLPRRAINGTPHVRDVYPLASAGSQLITFAVESFGCLGESGGELVEQLDIKTVGGGGG